MYCLYSVFFSFRTPYTSFPGTFVFFVVLNPPNPIIFRIIASSGSSSAFAPLVSTCIFSASLPPFVSAGGFDEGCDDTGLASLRLLAGLEVSCGLATRGPRGGERARVLVLVPFRAGERERVRCLSDLGGGSSRSVSPLVHSYLGGVDDHKPLRDRWRSRLAVRSRSLRSLPSRPCLSLSLSLSLSLPPPLDRGSPLSLDRLRSRRLSIVSRDLDRRLRSSRPCDFASSCRPSRSRSVALPL